MRCSMEWRIFLYHICSDGGTPPSWKPTRKVIIYFHMTKGFTLFNIYLTSVKVEKKLAKNLHIPILFITLPTLNK